jgi:hypothetical protein
MPKRRRRVAVSEPSLCLEQFALVNQMGGHPMSEPVQCRICDTSEPSQPTEIGEPANEMTLSTRTVPPPPTGRSPLGHRPASEPPGGADPANLRREPERRACATPRWRASTGGERRRTVPAAPPRSDETPPTPRRCGRCRSRRPAPASAARLPPCPRGP